MDRWADLVAIAHRRLRLRRLLVAIERNPKLLEEYPMTPKLAGLSTAMATLKDSLEVQAEQMLNRVTALNARTPLAFAKAKAMLDASESSLSDVEAFVASLEGSNGGPTLSGSSASSGQSQPATAPAADPAAAAQTEQLTVHGVSQA